MTEAYPKSWTQIPIEDCLLAYGNGRKIRQGWSPQCENHPAETMDDWGVLKTSAIQDGEYVESANKQIPKKLAPRTQLEVEAGDILITCAGPRLRCGVTCLVRKTRPKLLISGKMYQLRVDPEIIDRHLLELFLRESGTKKKIDEMKTGISDSGLNLTHSRFATLDVPLPPLAEQKRIVSKIEELFSELDAGEESLWRARRQLGVYRQSLLKQAFEGKLTEAWRKQNPHLLESSDQLLNRIQTERQACYVQQLKKWEKAMKAWEKTGEDDKRPSKPREPEEPTRLSSEEIEELVDLPNGWCWMTLESLSSPEPRSIQSGPFGSSLKHEEFTNEGILVIGIDNVQKGYFSSGSQNRISQEKYKELEKYTARPKDFLITVMATVGRCCRIPDEIETAIITKHVYRVSPNLGMIDPDYLVNAVLGCPAIVLQIEKDKFGQTRPGLNGGFIKALPVPLCSLPEQQEIVRLLDEQFTVIEQNEREIDAALKRSAALRQSILKKAFTGQLVPQDPTDEPASALLERIREERASDSAPKRNSRKSASGSKSRMA